MHARELRQKKLVVDKLRQPYLERTKYYNQPTQGSQGELEATGPKSKLDATMTKTLGTQGFNEHEADAPVSRKGQLELDLYINLIMKNSPNIDEFVYLVRNPESDDPYDLLLKNYFHVHNQQKKGARAPGKSKATLPSMTQTAASQPAQHPKDDRKNEDYYTISIKGLCHFRDGKPVEFIGLVDWLKERETYDKIKNLAFFANFRKWKTLKMWSKNYKSFKQKVAKKSLQAKLLTNYPELREAILTSRETLYEMANLKFIDLNVLRENQNEASDIGKFVTQQETKAAQTQTTIQAFSKDVHSCVNAAIEARLEIFRNQISQSSENETFKKQPVGQKGEGNHIYGVAENPYEALSFPENMSYDKRSILRKECHRFVRFSFFVDFLVQDALRSIYVRSLRAFVEEIEELAAQSEPVVLRELEKGKQATFKEPMFQLQLATNLDYSAREADLTVESTDVPDYKFPTVGEEELRPEDFAGYNLLTYPFLISYDAVDDFNEHQKKFAEYCEPRAFTADGPPPTSRRSSSASTPPWRPSRRALTGSSKTGSTACRPSRVS
jgi:hypothetical protein